MNNKNGTVYFILDTSVANLVKVRLTRNLQKRFKQLATANCNLELI